MFEHVAEKFSRAVKTLRGEAKFTEENIKSALSQIRIALLEADVAISVIQDFIKVIKEKVLGTEVTTALTPEQALFKTVQEELINLLGKQTRPLNLNTEPPAVIMMLGLQGAGKTTTTAKLAVYLRDTLKKKVLMVSTDIYRPAAIEQLKILGLQIDIPVVEISGNQEPKDIVKNALTQAKKMFIDVLLVDTAGRLHIDENMMAEIKQLSHQLNPVEKLFVIDSMMGQDAVVAAKAFHDGVGITGVIATKIDGDARGGAIFAVKHVTGQPIKFLGVGEKTHALEVFYPDRIASRILGMGDVLGLIEEVERKADKKLNEKMAKKISKGLGFDLEDFRQQLTQMNSMGGMGSLMSKLPGMGQMPSQHMDNNQAMVKRSIAIIDSMTMKERRMPKLIVGSRKRRIAQGSGTQLLEVNKLLKQYDQMQTMMQKAMKPGAMQKMMRGMQGALPPGLANMLQSKKEKT